MSDKIIDLDARRRARQPDPITRIKNAAIEMLELLDGADPEPPDEPIPLFDPTTMLLAECAAVTARLKAAARDPRAPASKRSRPRSAQ